MEGLSAPTASALLWLLRFPAGHWSALPGCHEEDEGLDVGVCAVQVGGCSHVSGVCVLPCMNHLLSPGPEAQ